MLKFLVCGFMGAGKTTYLNNFSQNISAKDTTCNCVDLDQVIYEQLAEKYLSLSDYIEKEGWYKFRELEYQNLEILLLKDNAKHQIIALGGGVLESTKTKELIKNSSSILIYLKSDFNTLWNRIKNSEERPLVKLGKDKIHQKFISRESEYLKSNFTASSYQEFEDIINDVMHKY